MASKSKMIRPYDEKSWTFEKSTFMRSIWRINRNHLIILSVLFALLLVFDLNGTISKVNSYIRGPAEITGNEILSGMNDIPFRDVAFRVTVENSEEYDKKPSLQKKAYVKNGTAFVAITGSGFENTQMAPVDKTKGKVANPEIKESDIDPYTAESEWIVYKYLKIGDKLLITKMPLGASHIDMRGTLTYLPADMRKIVVDKSELDDGDVLPYFFDATGESFTTMPTDVGFSLILFVLWLMYFIVIMRRVAKLERNQLYKDMFVNHGSVEDNAREIDMELGGGGVYGTTRMTVTPSWRITNRLLSCTMKLKDKR